MEQEILKKLSREYLKSYYSINSYIGCTINCAYCFLAPIKIIPMRPIKVADEKELVEEMINEVYFKENETIISLNNRTDPFINNEVKESTFKILDALDSKNLKNIVTITSKGLLTEEDAKKLDEYKNIQIVIMVTYNGINKEIQPIDISVQETTIKNVSKCKNVKLIQQLRPIIPNINDNEELLRKLVNFAMQYCDATIYQGIRVNQFIKDRLSERNYEYNGIFDHHKQKSQEVDNIFERIREENPDYPIFDHTSCGLSYLFNLPDYNLHFTKCKCSKNCLNYDKCFNEKEISYNYDLKEELEKLGITENYHMENGVLFIDGALDDEKKSYIKHNLHLPVKSQKRESTFSEKIIES